MGSILKRPFEFSSLVLLAGSFVILGFPVFFRNEAIFHLSQLHGNSLSDMLLLKWQNVNFRPFVYLIWFVIDRSFGLSAWPYLIANICFFVLTLVGLLLVARLYGHDISIIAPVLFSIGFAQTQQPLFNAMYGLFYPTMLSSFMLGIYFVLREHGEHSWRSLSIATMFFAVAVLSHSFASMLIPAFLFPHLWEQRGYMRKGKQAFLCAVGILFALSFFVVQKPASVFRPGLSIVSIAYGHIVQVDGLMKSSHLDITMILVLILTATALGRARNFSPRWLTISGLCVLVGFVSPSMAILALAICFSFVVRGSSGVTWLISLLVVSYALTIASADPVYAYFQPVAAITSLIAVYSAHTLVRNVNNRTLIRRLSMGLSLCFVVFCFGLRAEVLPINLKSFNALKNIRESSQNLHALVLFCRDSLNAKESMLVLETPRPAREVYVEMDPSEIGATWTSPRSLLRQFGYNGGFTAIVDSASVMVAVSPGQYDIARNYGLRVLRQWGKGATSTALFVKSEDHRSVYEH